MKKRNPPVMMLYAKPLRIAKSICPDNMLAANLRPKDTALAKYEMNSIKTNKGKKPKGQPAGTKSEKNSNPSFIEIYINVVFYLFDFD